MQYEIPDPETPAEIFPETPTPEIPTPETPTPEPPAVTSANTCTVEWHATVTFRHWFINCHVITSPGP